MAPIQNTNSQDHLPEIGKKLAYKANREGGEDHCPDLSGRKTIEVDSSPIDHYDKLLSEVELYITQSAKAHDAHTFARLQSVPGIGTILALVILDEIQDIARFPRGQDFVSYWRLGKCAKESKGKRLGTSGKTIGTVHLRGACAAAAILCLRHNQPGKEYFTKLARKPGKAKALPVLAHKLARAVDDLLTRAQACALPRVVPASPLRGEHTPGASLADNG